MWCIKYFEILHECLKYNNRMEKMHKWFQIHKILIIINVKRNNIADNFRRLSPIAEKYI